MSAGSTITLVAVPAPPPETGLWVSFALGIAALVVAALLARHRAMRPEPAPSRRGVRIFRSSVTCAAALTLMGAPQNLSNGTDEIEAALGVTASLVLLTLLAAVLLGTADLLLDAFNPERTRRWLALAPPCFAMFVLGILGATGWMDIITAEPDPRQAMLAIAIVAASLTWWSHLPAPGRKVARVFE